MTSCQKTDGVNNDNDSVFLSVETVNTLRAYGLLTNEEDVVVNEEFTRKKSNYEHKETVELLFRFVQRDPR